MKNDDGDTPILYSCRHSQLSSLKTMLKHGDNCFHVVLDNQESLGTPIEVLKVLADEGANINLSNNIGYSPLRLACLQQNSQQVECLLDLGADINDQKSLIKETSLMTACRNLDTEIVMKLLRRGADIRPMNIHGQTALALACLFNRLENVRALIHIGATVAVCDRDGHTPLYTAVINKNIDIALEILATPAYFPLNPVKERAFTERSTSMADVRRIEDELLESFEKASYNEDQLQIILHWAVSNGALKLAQHCVSRRQQVLELKRSGATWLHIASVNGNVEIAQLFLEKMLSQLQKTKAIIRQNSQGESPLTISIKQKYESQQTLFLNEIRQLGATDKGLMESNGALGSRILELLAEYETPGHEDVLKELLQKWFGGEHYGDQQNFTALHWAVRRSQPAVVWWLLSKGGYSSGYAIENARELVPDQYVDSDMLARVANPNNKRKTSKPALMDGRNPALDLEGNIVDIYATGEIVRMPYTKAKSLMKRPKENWEEHDLDELKKTLGQSGHDQPVRSISSQNDIDYNDMFSDGMAVTSNESMLYLCLLSITTAYIDYPKDLACRLACDSDRSEVEHTVLMKHFDRSWAEVAAGGKRYYMKPQCVLPYLTLGVYTGKRGSTDGSNEREESVESHNLRQIIHGPMTLDRYYYWTITGNDKTRNSRQIKHKPVTLDQYYYPTIADTDERDKDQVLSKFLDKQGKQSDRKILMVNQLWIWIIDEKTIITATSEHPEQKYKGNLLHTTLDNLLYSDTRSRFERAISVQSVMELILGVAVGLSTEKTIPTGSPERDSRGLFKKMGPIEIFRESIRDTADGETKLFQNFRSGLDNKVMQQEPQSRSHIISAETKLLDESRDIRDELRILRSLAEDQDVVWKQALSDLQYYHPCTPADVKKDLDEMLSEAEKMTSYITTLLDLRQAEYSRIQANDSANQSNSIFIFTVITIVFLPLSFLSSLFALNVTVFPHESGNLAYTAGWIFPILCELSLTPLKSHMLM
ncbi:hypothetical protein F4820DRAFT_457119 [Hypoxylon rubiginosum]|uniref:Uncharacterized protein n=1 Tax=Hypoxylon rubiginosum TaxID=110542 RepID=A0ACB9Z8A1_9PEZI|nr:hypothetical protein F4820DRAFT_457119 [Hypoxylon rubiginosum]